MNTLKLKGLEHNTAEKQKLHVLLRDTNIAKHKVLESRKNNLLGNINMRKIATHKAGVAQRSHKSEHGRRQWSHHQPTNELKLLQTI